jgi:hypothetical protein
MLAVVSGALKARENKGRGSETSEPQCGARRWIEKAGKVPTGGLHGGGRSSVTGEIQTAALGMG